MNSLEHVYTKTATVSLLESNRLLRNTYALLSMTLLFSAFTAGVSMVLELPHPGLIVTLLGYFGLLFLVNRFQNSVWGLVFVFALTGFMGMTLGPILNLYLSHFVNGGLMIMTALGGTGFIFVGLSAYVLTTRKNFNFLGGMLMAGMWVALLAGIAAIFLPEMTGLHLAVSSMFILLMSGMILFQTSTIIHGGEDNYILATLSLYVSIFNLFTSLLQILGILNSDE
ncbi:MAG: Bax inhibitor-1/YccA family protein [Methylococcaceae bacterium]